MGTLGVDVWDVDITLANGGDEIVLTDAGLTPPLGGADDQVAEAVAVHVACRRYGTARLPPSPHRAATASWRWSSPRMGPENTRTTPKPSSGCDTATST